MTLRIPSWLVIAAATLAIAALVFFGVRLVFGSSLSADDAEETIRGYFSALAEGDGEEACSKLTDDAITELEAQIEEQGAGILGENCEEFVGQVAKDPLVRNAGLEDVEVEDVDVSGDTATVTVEGANTAIQLESDGGEWRISDDTIRESFLLNL